MDPDDGWELLVAGPDDEGRRLDKVLRSALPRLGLSEIYGALRKGAIRVNDARSSPDARLSEGDRIAIRPATLSRGATGGRAGGCIGPNGSASLPGLESIRDILVAETEHLLFVNKPRGLLSHGPGSVEERMRAALASRVSRSLSFAPGPLHRLDRNTSGIMAFPATAAGARAFGALLRQRRLRKLYLALLEGGLPGPAEWRDRITRDKAAKVSRASPDGEEAIALASPLLASGGSCLALVELRTGLTHQIRLQAALRGAPLAGDGKYGGSPARGGYLLHAISLEFPDPPFPDVPRRVVARLPPEAVGRLAGLFGSAALDAALADFFRE